nr:MAG TPA: hypothetical protein [Caudoviricetes sp.]
MSRSVTSAIISSFTFSMILPPCISVFEIIKQTFVNYY